MMNTAPLEGGESDGYATFLRHERLTVTMAWPSPRTIQLHEVKGRTGPGRVEGGRDAPPQPELFQLYEEVPGGWRPETLAEPRPQERANRHTVEQLADFAPVVQILDVPVPQMVDQRHSGAPAGYRSARDIVAIPSSSRSSCSNAGGCRAA